MYYYLLLYLLVLDTQWTVILINVDDLTGQHMSVVCTTNNIY